MDYNQFMLSSWCCLSDIEINLQLVLQIVSASAIGLAVIYFWKIWRSYGFFKKRGIKTPPYQFFFGNLAEIRKEGFSEVLVSWTKKYGKTYGYYEGHYPVLVTSDLEMIDEIFFKQFSNFTGRRLTPQQISDTDNQTNTFSAARNRWRRIRSIVNPIFSSSKLKEHFPSLKACLDQFLCVIEDNIGTEIDVTEYLDRMTMDIVWKSIYGIDVNAVQNNPSLIYLDKAREANEGFSNFNLYYLAITYFYEFRPIMLPIVSFYSSLMRQLNGNLGSPIFWLLSRAQDILDQKIIKKTQGHDFLSNLLELQSDLNLEYEKQQYDSSSKLTEKKLTHRELIAIVVGFMLAGFDPTASTLSFCFYILTNHPEEMAKLQEEIDSLKDTEDITNEKINELEYLDMFVKEVLRMYPVGNVVMTRRCTQATKVKGIDIPDNQLIVVDVLSLHYDPAYWGDVDPNTFYPNRFADINKINKLAYMPFGIGSRLCVGMKFALMEIKLTLVKVLMKYDVYPASSKSNEMVIRDGTFTVRRPKYGVPLVFKKRDL